METKTRETDFEGVRSNCLKVCSRASRMSRMSVVVFFDEYLYGQDLPVYIYNHLMSAVLIDL